MQPLADGLGRMIIGKHEFHGRKPCLRCRIKTVEERHFVEHHGEIGGETGHRRSSCWLSAIAARPAKPGPWLGPTTAPPAHHRRGPSPEPRASENLAARP